MAAERPASWSRAQRILHWAIAALVLLAAPMSYGRNWVMAV